MRSKYRDVNLQPMSIYSKQPVYHAMDLRTIKKRNKKCISILPKTNKLTINLTNEAKMKRNRIINLSLVLSGFDGIKMREKKESERTFL